ncbi:cellulose synthase complex periplasmic endoglucanase BcsZ [Shewanella violacea]|uniref:cellulase n=1 Tax=Shewanella violacea (strain JCM 10179 / CIP 106290 / LMG 19151 / DSS12) TaxID=637905 RepID=D4ZDH6_SHEVD|nr:cellulose synthase complex periplasmic endoglucanase BcsZ [Shewanella violacea]BAJ00098.1 endo-1,4-beta-glucanase [Shewanella violacea DSS12]
MKKLVWLTCLSLMLTSLSSQVFALECQWPEWNTFKTNYLQDGRVVDASDPRLITTSEGQSYGLFFALVANDKQAFQQILTWTETHLAEGDLTAHLPAWLWGQKTTGTYGVLDNNSASDSDLWIAYSLAEAGRLWDNYYYKSLSHLVASRILREETLEVPGIGNVLLPGPQGFDKPDGSYRLNPSYVPLQLLSRMATLYPKYTWQSLYKTSATMLTDTAQHGFSPDWVTLKSGVYTADDITGNLGSYNAIRSYLWIGMLNDADKEKSTLLQTMQAMVAATQQLSAPPREVDTLNGQYTEAGSPGFSAALLPFLSASNQAALVEQQAERAHSLLQRNDGKHYYDNVLGLFGEAWYQERFRFGEHGELQTQCQK